MITAERGGSASVEAAILAVLVGVLVVFAVAVGRLTTTESVATDAARAAARVATLQRGAAVAQDAATAAARSVLDQRGVHCDPLDVTVDVRGFAQPLGSPASVVVTVRCGVSWSDLGMPGRVVEGRFASPIDPWRERS